ncbi:Stretch-activated cation channel Mid1 [Ceraceosorus bombacis]|uniref:Stretch-activated cation channel Mid1 n=1 Tax=Ceraceosorus bombacis TaxID=401625 RepID=A0A0N7L960_9BASI|nr:Stretch-activated cation channel Mid1 [Ceraceosorus bombacis]
MSLPLPNLDVTILPSTGAASIDPYFNSSLCAAQTAARAWAAGNGPGSMVQLNASNTQRGILRDQKLAGQQRRQWDITGLEAATNYTVWLSAQDATLNNVTVWPAIKFATKTADNCRLVYDVPFCPNVAYAIPIGPQVSTDNALSTINRTVSPNLSNFTQLLGTFPCGDPYFGPYSGVKDCGDCLDAYQDWLCAVAMPRCVDALDDPNIQSAAAQNSTVLTGGPMSANTDLLPYVVNRRDGRNESRQTYVDDELSPGTYGELLPCIYTCYFVSRSCPAPLVQWSCPKWGISAQRSYGAFADSGAEGIGARENGGAGSDFSRWGGPTRYIAQDAFGNAFCNAMGVDTRLSEDNAALPALDGRRAWRASVFASVALYFLLLA